jgi:hypothetical protein
MLGSLLPGHNPFFPHPYLACRFTAGHKNNAPNYSPINPFPLIDFLVRIETDSHLARLLFLLKYAFIIVEKKKYVTVPSYY